MTEKSPSIEEILGANGLLERNLDGFEFRPSQVEMAMMVREGLQNETSVIVEAGTGTGKTFGYLVPLILSGKKAVISTRTKNLQEQIVFKDIPLLRKATGLKFDILLMKGRRNYLCLHRYHQFFSQAKLWTDDLDEARRKLDRWLVSTPFADRAEIPWMTDDDPLWDVLSCTSEQCLGPDCLHMEECFLNRLRKRAAQARIIVVNHHLFFADLKVKRHGFGEIIPRFQVAVFDEAHHIEDIATANFGESLSTGQLMELAEDFEKRAKHVQDIKASLLPLRAGCADLHGAFLGQEEKGRIDAETLDRMKGGPVQEIRQGLRFIHEASSSLESNEPEFLEFRARAGHLMEVTDEALKPRDADWLNWYERRRKTVVFHASPLDVSEGMKTLLFDRLETVIFTSATLSIKGDFSYFRKRVGAPEDGLEAVHPSHFDFKTQTLMYLPKDLPPPSNERFVPEAGKRIREILLRTKGRALVLFTSHRNLNGVYQALDGSMPYTVFRQGDAPKSVLLQAFKEDVHSILMATGSFWEGVDVPGETLSCLIIDKLPFDSPGDPLIAARIESIRSRGGNPFLEYQVPAAIISLKQGLGRLIRQRTDRGILSILDVRILNSRYGRLFLESLPPMPVCHHLDDLERFFSGEPSTVVKTKDKAKRTTLSSGVENGP
jgi:ATP-dependent DNA helicase DinG